MSKFICKGCTTHGTCLDEEAIKNMLALKGFNAQPEPYTVGTKKIDFELVLQSLLDMRGKEGYNRKLQEVAAFIMENSEPNKPSSLRSALNLQASESFAGWSDETAKKELDFCNTKKLDQL